MEAGAQKEAAVANFDIFVIMGPFVALMVAWALRLDETIAAPSERNGKKRTIPRSDLNEHPGLCDPDGRPWPADGKR